MADSQFLALLEKEKDEIASFLPSYLRTDDERDRFFANARAVDQNYLLKGCSAQSMLNCVVDAAKRGLIIGGPDKHCAVVPFDTKNGGKMAVLITQWQGKAFLWHRAGAITKLKPQVVYVGDEFELIEGDEDRIIHKPNYQEDRSPAFLNDIKNIVGSYAIAWLPDGQRLHRFVSRSELKRTMEMVKRKNGDKLGFGWTDWLPEMCRKTAVHRLDGLIQPPPEQTKEQKEAWMLTEKIVTSDDIADAPDDMPPPPRQPKGGVELVVDPPKDGSSAGKTAEKGTPHPPTTAASTADEPITQEQEDELFDTCSSLGMKASMMAKIAKEQFQVPDLKNLKQGQLADFGAALAKAAAQ